ncbi:MAG: glycosyltransferase [Candidatus Bathyarchaeia archaeon]
MRVVIFTWEYPPRTVGKLADYMKELALTLARNKVETYVVTYHDFLTGEFIEEGKVKICRVTNPVKTHISILTWVLTLNQEVERASANIYYQTRGQIDLIDTHDWHFVPAAVTLKKAFGIPFIFSVESLEDHRSQGANQPFNMAVKSIEWLGTYEANLIVVKSEFMADELTRIHQVPKSRIKIAKRESKLWPKTVLKIYGCLKEANFR